MTDDQIKELRALCDEYERKYHKGYEDLREGCRRALDEVEAAGKAADGEVLDVDPESLAGRVSALYWSLSDEEAAHADTRRTLAEKDAENARLRALVEEAYREGREHGRDYERATQYGWGNHDGCWETSKAKEALR